MTDRLARKNMELGKALLASATQAEEKKQRDGLVNAVAHTRRVHSTWLKKQARANMICETFDAMFLAIERGQFKLIDGCIDFESQPLNEFSANIDKL